MYAHTTVVIYGAGTTSRARITLRWAGLAEVERAKADGRWDVAYDSSANATVPDDLAKARAGQDVSERRAEA